MNVCKNIKNMFGLKRKQNRGFTLVELVIVVAILAILVGLLAPQYTKYVEKSRKAADARNMDELVKAVGIYAVEGEHALNKDGYIITIGSGSGTNKTSISPIAQTEDDKLIEEVNKAVPGWDKITTKSKKWAGNGNKNSTITATVKVAADGQLSVSYSPSSFAEYMGSGDTK